MAYIDVIQPEDADGDLKQVYDTIVATRGKIAEVHKIQSLNSSTIPAHMELYRSVMFSQSPLSRAEREMIAVVVSQTNECRYCVAHHAEALLHFWNEQARVDALVHATADGIFDHPEDTTTVPGNLDLSPRHVALCCFARRVTDKPGAGEDGSAVEKLRTTAPGITDRAILDATLVIGYFNFVNRIVLTLGVELESNQGGYKYDAT